MDISRFRTACWKVAQFFGLVPVDELKNTIHDVLCGDAHFLQGVQSGANDIAALVHEISQLERRLNFSTTKSNHTVSAALRQTILMTLIPAHAFDASYSGSIDRAVNEHLTALGLPLSTEERHRLRDICINIRRLRHLDSKAARRASKSLADVRAMSTTFARIMASQYNRCIWCGVDLNAPDTRMSLEHMAPKHIGDDLSDGSNWAIACTTCNAGKGELLSWATSPFANGFLRARHFVDPKTICPETRWIVLVRDRQCDSCGRGPTDVELGVYREVSTGLAIPQNCSTTCVPCANAESKEVLTTHWESSESSRTFG